VEQLEEKTVIVSNYRPCTPNISEGAGGNKIWVLLFCGQIAMSVSVGAGGVIGMVLILLYKLWDFIYFAA
jgi:hypothetical protein